jgi:hypothetical protein
LNKSYVGSAINLKNRLTIYLNPDSLKLLIKNNNSIIYRALLKYNYQFFSLIIIEFCDTNNVLIREQYYLDNFEFEYNILKTAGSLKGFKHKKHTKERISAMKLGKPCSEITRIKLYSNSQAFSLKIENLLTKQIIYLPSIRRTANYIKVHHSYIAKCLSNKGYCKIKDFLIKKIID